MTAARLVLGTAQLGMAYGVAGNGRTPTELQAAYMLRAAYDLGITSFDTAPGYGAAETRIGRFLSEHGLHDEITVCTKLPSLAKTDGVRVENEVEGAITSSLRRLRAESIDTYLLHDAADLARHGRALVDALVQQRHRGRVVNVGVSAYGPDELEWLDDYPELEVVQHPFNFLDRRLLRGDWPRRLASSGTRLQLRSVLLQGLLAMPVDAIPAGVPGARGTLRALAAVLEALDLSAAEAAVPFALSLDPDGVVVGAETTAQLEALVASAETRLPEEIFGALEADLGNVPEAVVDPRTWGADLRS